MFRRAHDELGFELRPLQREAAQAALEGRDALVVLPTGAGKSAIYQVAGLGRSGPTVVISPLLSLQQDQVEAIGSRLGGAAALNSLLRPRQRNQLLQQARAGELEFVFVSPEMLADGPVVQALKAGQPSLVVVDEAHCISAWGHDFRPDYLALGGVVEALGRPPVLALTASAAPPVREEIIERLRLSDPLVVLGGFQRPELHLSVSSVLDLEQAEQEALSLVRQLRLSAAGPQRGLLYVARRHDAERLAGALTADGHPALPYHAGLARQTRERTLQEFRDDPSLSVVATNAFGMGIDVPDVRFVLHVEPPESLDAYYQEVGRAGRDGERATATCFTVLAGSSRRRAGTAPVDVAAATEVFEAISDGTRTRAELARRTGMGRNRLTTVLADLEAVNAVRVRHRYLTVGPVPLDPAALSALSDNRRAVADSRAHMLRRYLESNECRWQQVLAYFGEVLEGPCQQCDRCAAHTAGNDSDAPSSAPANGFEPEDRVTHDQFGLGVVLSRQDERLTVLFEQAGYRVLDEELANGGLLQPATDP